MPELPEVETTRRGLAPAVGRRVRAVTVREPRLRLPVPGDLARRLRGSRLNGIGRRGKYLLFRFDAGALLAHLGMSGSWRLCPVRAPWRLHDHLQLSLDRGPGLRYHDPRRFGLLVWAGNPPERHPLLRALGPEPLDPGFTAEYLHARARGRRAAVKSYLMDARTVVGVGNIYASEALHRAGVRPGRAAGRVSRNAYARIVRATRTVLEDALRHGGTTLRDYRDGRGLPGAFALDLRVYGRAGEPCRGCGTPIRARVIGQRSSFYCPNCQA